MIPGCRVVELRADRTPGEQAQGCYIRVLAEHLDAGVPLRNAVWISRLAARSVAANASRNAREHTRQGLITERFVDQEPYEACHPWW